MAVRRVAQTISEASDEDGLRKGATSSPPRRRTQLRHALWRLLLWSLLPLVVGLGWGVWSEWRLHRQSAHAQLAVAAETLVLAVDRDVAMHREKLQALAASPLIDAGDWAGVHDHAMNIVAGEPGTLIVLADASGQQLVNTGVPRGDPLPHPAQVQSAPPQVEWQGHLLPAGSQGLSRRVRETGLPAYSGLYYGLTVKRPTVSVVIPVVRHSRVAYTMTLAFPPQSLGNLISAATGIAAGGRTVLMDQNGIVIASNPRGPVPMGAQGSLLDERAEQVGAVRLGRGTARDGVPVHLAVARSATTGWSVRVAVPDGDVLAPARHAAYLFASLTAAALLLGGLLASLLARRLARPLRRLAMAARDFQEGREVDIPESRIEEIDALGQALAAAVRKEVALREEVRARVVAEEREAAARQAAESSRASEERLRRLLDNLRAFVGVLDLDGTLVEINRAALARPGLSRQEIVGHPFWETYWWAHDAQVQAQLRAAIDKARRGKRSHYEVQIRVGPSELRWIDFAIAPLANAEGSITHLVASGVDISERVKTEAALRDADRQKDQFIATLAHELRNPLSPIRSSAHIIKLRQPTDSVIVRAQEMIERQATQMARLVDDLLDISRITFGRVELRREHCSLTELVAHAVESMRGTIAGAHHRLELRLPDDRLPVDADPARINQILLNVLSNAVRFTPAGGTITVSASREGAHARVCVADTGVGIDPGMLERIFEMFVQERPSGLAGSSGLGIGLGLARKLTAMHGGTLVGRSEGHGRGSEFVLHLPLSVQATQEAPKPDAVPGAAAGSTVLVVDDNVDAAESLKAMLELQGGHRVGLAFDGLGAVKAFESLRPAAVVLDIGLPDISGYEAARRIRALDRERGAVLIALTGWGQEADRQRALDAGFDHHLTKPADPQRLFALVDAARAWPSATS
jgi:PAS domain S-box-containing protein